MKRLVIGDIHGHWDGFKKIYDLEDPDEYEPHPIVQNALSPIGIPHR